MRFDFEDEKHNRTTLRKLLLAELDLYDGVSPPSNDSPPVGGAKTTETVVDTPALKTSTQRNEAIERDAKVEVEAVSISF